MTHGKMKIYAISLFCLIATASTIGMAQTASHPQTTSRGLLAYDPKSHDFGNIPIGASVETVFQIWNGGGCCSLTFSISENYSYVSVFPTSGTSNGEAINITVMIDTTGLPLGTYPCEIDITSDGGNGIFWANFTLVQYPDPTLSCIPTSIDFGFVPNGANATGTLYVQNIGCGTLTYSVLKDASWLLLDPTSGDSIGEADPITVTAVTQGLTPNQYEATITVTSNGGTQQIPVTMNLTGIRIEGITASKGKITAVLTNIGDKTINNINWSIEIRGGIFRLLDHATSSRILSLEPNHQYSFATGQTFHAFGPITVTVRADYAKTLVIQGRIFYNVVRLI